MHLCLQPLTETSGKQMLKRSPWEPWHLVAVALVTPVALAHESERLRRSVSLHQLNTWSAGGESWPWASQIVPSGAPALQCGNPVSQVSVSPKCTLAREGNAKKKAARVLLPSEFICLTFFREAVGVQPRFLHVPVAWA